MPSYFDQKRSLFGISGLPFGMVDPGPHKQQVEMMINLLNISEGDEVVLYDRQASHY